MILVELQLEQAIPHPRQVPLIFLKPLAQVWQLFPSRQKIQFLEQLLLQVPLKKYFEGGQPVQLVAVPLHSLQPWHLRQVELTVKNDPGLQL